MIKYYDNLKINFFLLGEGPTDAINDRVSTAEKIYLKLILTEFALHWWINICILKKQRFVNLKVLVILMKFNHQIKDKINEISLNGNFYDFSTNYNLSVKQNILNKHLIKEDNIK